jgi:hypothetical protein
VCRIAHEKLPESSGSTRGTNTARERDSHCFSFLMFIPGDLNPESIKFTPESFFKPGNK